MSRRHAPHLVLAAAVLIAAPVAAQQSPCFEPGRSTSSRVIAGPQLERVPSHSALDLIEQYVPNAFDVIGGSLALRARGMGARGEILEPALFVDGFPMEMWVADVLRGYKARDLVRIEVHLGPASAWRSRPGGTPAVIEVFTVQGQHLIAQRSSRNCGP